MKISFLVPGGLPIQLNIPGVTYGPSRRRKSQGISRDFAGFVQAAAAVRSPPEKIGESLVARAVPRNNPGLIHKGERDMKMGRVCRIAGTILLALGAPFALEAADAKPSSPAPVTEKIEPDEGPMQNMKFRNLGPAVGGGRVSAVAGIPGDPNVLYIGAAAGGVWKSVDGGNTFKPIFEKYPSSIGAIAVAPSNPSLVWVGTGEANPRNDVMDGHGVYFSADAGNSWRFMGLADVGQISRVVIDPYDPSTVLVAALGHVWAPNPDRGVYRTVDGGQTWKKVLYVNEQTGACELAMAPGNPKVLFAGMWQVRRFPWELVDGGPGSGVYRSTDGGATWTKLTKDIPEGPLGRIALAVAATNSNPA